MVMHFFGWGGGGGGSLNKLPHGLWGIINFSLIFNLEQTWFAKEAIYKIKVTIKNT